jgi:glycine/D-amino acid oxidase-like deaminating enzyme
MSQPRSPLPAPLRAPVLGDTVLGDRMLGDSAERYDVIVAGFGIADASAALEAARAGARVLLLERAAVHGGTTCLAGGHFYLGGGTAVQQATGHQAGTRPILGSHGRTQGTTGEPYGSHRSAGNPTNSILDQSLAKPHNLFIKREYSRAALLQEIFPSKRWPT